MRHRLNIWQSGIHSPLRFGFDRGSQFGRLANGCVHSAVSEHTHTSKIKKRRPVNTTSIVKLPFWAYIPSGNSTCVKDMDRHRGGAEHCCSSSAILPGHNRVAPVKRPTLASDQWLSRAAGPAAEEPSNPRRTPRWRSALHREQLLNGEKKFRTPYKRKRGVHSEIDLTIFVIIII